MIAKILDRKDKNEFGTETILDNITEIFIETKTEEKAEEILNIYTSSRMFGKANSKKTLCTLITFYRKDTLSNNRYSDIVLVYCSTDKDTETTIYYMNDKGVTIDRVDY